MDISRVAIHPGLCLPDVTVNCAPFTLKLSWLRCYSMCFPILDLLKQNMKLQGLWLEVPVDRVWHLGRVPGILTDLGGTGGENHRENISFPLLEKVWMFIFSSLFPGQYVLWELCYLPRFCNTVATCHRDKAERPS